MRKRFMQTASEIPSDNSDSDNEPLVKSRSKMYESDVESEKSTSSLESSAKNNDMYEKELSGQVEK